jgi:hypothetical protein
MEQGEKRLSRLSKTYNRILEDRFTLKLINFGTVALFLDYWIGLFSIAWPSITANIWNPLLWKMENNGEHHVLDMIPILFMYMFFAWKFNRLNIKVWGLFALYFWYVVVSFHEISWWISYLIVNSYFIVPFLEKSGLWIPDTVMVISFFVFYKITRNKTMQDKARITWNIPYRYFAFLVAIYTIWILFQFPVTVNYYGHTIYYFNNIVNLWEIVVWISTIFVFLRTFIVFKPKPFGSIGQHTVNQKVNTNSPINFIYSLFLASGLKKDAHEENHNHNH